MKRTEPESIIGKRIRELIKRTGMSEFEFAKSIRVHPAQLNSWIKGRRVPRKTSLILLAKELNTTVDYLIGASQNETKGIESIERKEGSEKQMRKAQTSIAENATYLRVKDALQYYPISRAYLMKLAEKANAVRHIGRTVLIYRPAMDAYIESCGKADMLMDK